MKTIAAVVHEAGAPFLLEEVELDDLRPDEVLVRMVATGLCHTDLSVRAGYIPFPLPGVLGHEGAGVVEAVGSAVTRVVPGDHVLASFTSCGTCPNCTAGHSAYCHTFLPLNLIGGQRADGSYTITQNGQNINAHFFGQSSLSRHSIVDERSLVKVDKGAPLDILAPLGCGVQTGAGAVLNIVKPEPGSTIVVFGAGGVGLSAVMAAAMTGTVRIVSVDVVPSRLALAKELGATDTIDASTTDPVEAVRAMTKGIGVPYTIETVGNVKVLAQAIESLAPMGTCAGIGAPPAGSLCEISPQFMLDGRRYIGTTEGDSNPGFVTTLVKYYEQGKLPLDKMIKHYRFEDIEAAAADAHAGVTIKPVLRFD